MKPLEEVLLDLRYNYLLNKLTSSRDHEKVRAVVTELVSRGCRKELVVEVLETILNK